MYNGEDDRFWTREDVIENNFSKPYIRSYVIDGIQGIKDNLSKRSKEDKDNEGKQREMIKNLFRKYRLLFEIVLDQWIVDRLTTVDRRDIDTFYQDLETMFRKTCDLHGIPPSKWEFNDS